MKTVSVSHLIAALGFCVAGAQAADPLISNVVAVQRTGMKVVDISYDVVADSSTVLVSLQISSDGGTTFSVPVTSATGDIGHGVAVGTGKMITWDAGADWNNHLSSQVRFKVTASGVPADLSFIPAGIFTMGDTFGEGNADELPTRVVTLSPFYMGRLEVNKQTWDEVRTWGLSNGYTDLPAGAGKAPTHPVHSVNWWDAVKWCNAKSQKESLTPAYSVGGVVMKTGTAAPTVDWSANGYRLPSEAEWEKAARGGVSNQRFPNGNIISHTMVNFRNNGIESYWSGSTGYHPLYASGLAPYTSPVGSFNANGYGMHDMSGNIWEWCWDRYGAYPNEPPIDPKGPDSGASRVYRGGGWSANAFLCRSALRGSVNEPETRDDRFGFRICRTTVASSASGFAVSSDSAVDTRDLSDSDSDGLSYYDEVVQYGTNPDLADSDGDGLSDGWEVGRGRFSIIAGSFTWVQARADAQTRGGDLACFPDQNRWNRAMDTLGANAFDNYTGLWLGANDEQADGTWIWVNGEAFSFQLWATGRPSGTAGNTLDYAEVSGGAGSEIGKWYDRSSTTVRDGYILETGYATNPTVADQDGDGLNDSQEETAGTNPFIADTDSDGLNDGQDVNLTHTNPKLADSDGDGLNDAADDQDGDGLSNLAEITQHGTDPLKADTDGDGLSDSAELNHPASYFMLVSGSFTYAQATADAAAKRGRVASFPNTVDYSRMANKARQSTQGYLWIGLSDATTEDTWLWTDGSTATYSQWLTGQPSGGATENHVVIMENSTKWADTVETFMAAGYLFERVGLNPLDPDTDADGLSDGQEVNTTTSSPVLEDTDGDGLVDGAEVNTHGSSPLLTDTDADGLNDREEVEKYLSNPSLKDSDGDGFDDGFEVSTGFDPTKGTSTPDALSSIRTAVEFRFNAANGVSYRIEDSTDLEQWNTVETNIIGAGGVVTRFYSIENLPKRYFRARRN